MSSIPDIVEWISLLCVACRPSFIAKPRHNQKNSALADFCGGDRPQQIKITKARSHCRKVSTCDRNFLDKLPGSV
ncbi:hypothetical protein LC612_00385 [Nostoc sp. CHAB 5834]|nr:hypothetical protein [Nostoc sp. CHAB 5834]